ncbi:MAG TPA: hypothetical protein VHR15_13695 [Ktedonobacterales bacterium]|nr:hypothetical protein [Ktedonobacterales bacterium]
MSDIGDEGAGAPRVFLALGVFLLFPVDRVVSFVIGPLVMM